MIFQVIWRLNLFGHLQFSEVHPDDRKYEDKLFVQLENSNHIDKFSSVWIQQFYIIKNMELECPGECNAV